MKFIYCLFGCIFGINILYKSVVDCSSFAKNLSEAIFANYDSGLRPVCGGVTQVNLTLGIALRQVIDMDEPNQIIKLNLWIRLKWKDCLLQWNSSDYGGIDNIIVPYKSIWVPDLTLYDSVSTEFHGMLDYRPSIYSDGTVYYNFPTIIEVLCPIDVTKFPFDTQICSLMFGSWSYHGFQLDLQPRTAAGDISSMKANVEWDVLKVIYEKHVVYYGCCPEPYPDVTFEIHLKRKPAFYVSNIILPSLMITVLAVLGFILPVDSGEKVSLEITVMLAMSVFQLLVADKLPPSALSTPWIVTFFNFILGLSGVSTIIQVLVINVYYRENKSVPSCIMKGVIIPICFIMFVSLPDDARKSFCSSKNKINVDEQEKTHLEQAKIDNAEVWRCFSKAVDRLGMMLFSLSLAIGSGLVFQKITA